MAHPPLELFHSPTRESRLPVELTGFPGSTTEENLPIGIFRWAVTFRILLCIICIIRNGGEIRDTLLERLEAVCTL